MKHFFPQKQSAKKEAAFHFCFVFNFSLHNVPFSNIHKALLRSAVFRLKNVTPFVRSITTADDLILNFSMPHGSISNGRQVFFFDSDSWNGKFILLFALNSKSNVFASIPLPAIVQFIPKIMQIDNRSSWCNSPVSLVSLASRLDTLRMSPSWCQALCKYTPKEQNQRNIS